MRLSQKSQSIIEYSVVIILVMAGLLLMRPYVIRSVNAHMKSWEDSVGDSMKESIKQASPTSVFTPVCPNTVCEPGETAQGCCIDCGSLNDTICCTAAGEDPTTTPYDCGFCGDGSCNTHWNSALESAEVTEDINNCCADCSPCGDLQCCTIIDPVTGATGVIPTASITTSIVGTGIDVGCPGDCNPPPACNHNGTCDSGEQAVCCDDCWEPDNGSCEPCEDIGNDPCDCHCGNGSCDITPPGGAICSTFVPENSSNCPGDCPAVPTSVTITVDYYYVNGGAYLGTHTTTALISNDACSSGQPVIRCWTEIYIGDRAITSTAAAWAAKWPGLVGDGNNWLYLVWSAPGYGGGHRFRLWAP